MTFEQWMKKVDQELEHICGMDHMCLGDFLYEDAFEDGATPKEVAQEVLEREGFPF